MLEDYESAEKTQQARNLANTPVASSFMHEPCVEPDIGIRAVSKAKTQWKTTATVLATLLALAAILALFAILRAGSQLKPAPNLKLWATGFDFGVVSLVSLCRCSFTFENAGGAALIVKPLKQSCGCLTLHWTGNPSSIAPAEHVVLEVEYRPKRLGPDKASIFVETNDPENPQVHLALTSEVREGIRLEPSMLTVGETPPGKTRSVKMEVVTKENLGTIQCVSGGPILRQVTPTARGYSLDLVFSPGPHSENRTAEVQLLTQSVEYPLLRVPYRLNVVFPVRPLIKTLYLSREDSLRPDWKKRGTLVASDGATFGVTGVMVRPPSIIVFVQNGGRKEKVDFEVRPGKTFRPGAQKIDFVFSLDRPEQGEAQCSLVVMDI